MKEKFPTYKFDLSDTKYSVLTDENKADLASYMRDENSLNLLIDGRFWGSQCLPNMKDFGFVGELFIMWTNVDDLSDIQDCGSLEILTLDNGDKTKIDFSNFPKLEKLFSWKRKGIKDAWKISTLKDLALAGIAKSDYSPGNSLDSIEKLRLIKTSVEDLAFLKRAKNLKRLDLRSMSKLKNIEFFEYLIDLEYLFLQANKVSDFKSVNGFINLKTCILKSKTASANTNHFSQLAKLERFTLNGNEQLRQVSREVNKKLQLE